MRAHSNAGDCGAPTHSPVPRSGSSGSFGHSFRAQMRAQNRAEQDGLGSLKFHLRATTFACAQCAQSAQFSLCAQCTHPNGSRCLGPLLRARCLRRAAQDALQSAVQSCIEKPWQSRARMGRVGRSPLAVSQICLPSGKCFRRPAEPSLPHTPPAATDSPTLSQWPVKVCRAGGHCSATVGRQWGGAGLPIAASPPLSVWGGRLASQYHSARGPPRFVHSASKR